jgi:FKBP-type peptidyl-prolyl cis-trans isomerase
LITALTIPVPFLLSGRPASAATENKPQEFKSIGTQAPPPDGSTPFVALENGVKIKDFRFGTGDSVVGSKSKVDIQCSGRLLNLNGVVFYNTKTNNPDGFGPIPLTLQLGIGQAVPGLESGLVGMKKGGIRRIIVPQELAYNAFPDLEPKPMNANDQRALDSVVKNPRRDGTILFDVSLDRLK